MMWLVSSSLHQSLHPPPPSVSRQNIVSQRCVHQEEQTKQTPCPISFSNDTPLIVNLDHDESWWARAKGTSTLCKLGWFRRSSHRHNGTTGSRRAP
jgi:hypothetical protein